PIPVQQAPDYGYTAVPLQQAPVTEAPAAAPAYEQPLFYPAPANPIEQPVNYAPQAVPNQETFSEAVHPQPNHLAQPATQPLVEQVYAPPTPAAQQPAQQYHEAPVQNVPAPAQPAPSEAIAQGWTEPTQVAVNQQVAPNHTHSPFEELLPHSQQTPPQQVNEPQPAHSPFTIEPEAEPSAEAAPVGTNPVWEIDLLDDEEPETDEVISEENEGEDEDDLFSDFTLETAFTEDSEASDDAAQDIAEDVAETEVEANEAEADHSEDEPESNDDSEVEDGDNDIVEDDSSIDQDSDDLEEVTAEGEDSEEVAEELEEEDIIEEPKITALPANLVPSFFPTPPPTISKPAFTPPAAFSPFVLEAQDDGVAEVSREDYEREAKRALKALEEARELADQANLLKGSEAEFEVDAAVDHDALSEEADDEIEETVVKESPSEDDSPEAEIADEIPEEELVEAEEEESEEEEEPLAIPSRLPEDSEIRTYLSLRRRLDSFADIVTDHLEVDHLAMTDSAGHRLMQRGNLDSVKGSFATTLPQGTANAQVMIDDEKWLCSLSTVTLSGETILFEMTTPTPLESIETEQVAKLLDQALGKESNNDD
ncbi:MAG: hypothetical protein AAF226_10740, partial [Verrucomicrobiota bacterium]